MFSKGTGWFFLKSFTTLPSGRNKSFIFSTKFYPQVIFSNIVAIAINKYMIISCKSFAAVNKIFFFILKTKAFPSDHEIILRAFSSFLLNAKKTVVFFSKRYSHHMAFLNCIFCFNKGNKMQDLPVAVAEKIAEILGSIVMSLLNNLLYSFP